MSKDRSTILQELIYDDIDTICQMLAQNDNTYLYSILEDRLENKTTEELEDLHRSRFDEIPDWLDEEE